MFYQIRYLYVVCILIILNFVIVKGDDDDDDGEYTASMNMMTSCPNYDNSNIDVTGLTYEAMEEDEQQKMKIGGKIVLNKKIDEQFQCFVKIVKEHEGDKEVVFGIVIKVCESMKDEKAPHKPLFDALGISECPVNVGEYKLNDEKEIIFKLDDFKDLMTKDYVGSYVLKVVCETPPNEDSCHEVEMSISQDEKRK